MPESAMRDRPQLLERIADLARDLERELVVAADARLTMDRLREARRELDEALDDLQRFERG
jgi:acyl-CoA reductase-like NAD-dependent aldehyde dehydrogenase